MIVLIGSDSLVLTTSSTSVIKAVVAYSDTTARSRKTLPPPAEELSRQTASVSAATNTTICDAAPENTTRRVDMINVVNTTAMTNTVTITLANPDGDRAMIAVPLNAGERLGYEHGRGFYVTDQLGATKTAAAD